MQIPRVPRADSDGHDPALSNGPSRVWLRWQWASLALYDPDSTDLARILLLFSCEIICCKFLFRNKSTKNSKLYQIARLKILDA
jgi:hypothetical protein